MQRNASLFFAEIPDDIGQPAANPDLGQMLVHEESLAFGIANDDTRHVECIFQRIQHHLRALRVHFQHNIRHIP